MYYEPSHSFNPDTVPSFPVHRANVFGAKCPITGQEFLNLSEVDGRLTVDPAKAMSELVAAQKAHTHAIAYAQDLENGSLVPKNRSIAERKALYESEQ
jgi:hypothetical protein